MAKDEFGNYVAGLQGAGITLPPTSSGGVFSETDFPVVGGVPQGSPSQTTAILIGNDGTQYLWSGGSWKLSPTASTVLSDGVGGNWKLVVNSAGDVGATSV